MLATSLNESISFSLSSFINLMHGNVSTHRNAVRLCIKAHSSFPESELFASLSTLTPETLMDTLALIFKGEAPANVLLFTVHHLKCSLLRVLMEARLRQI